MMEVKEIASKDYLEGYRHGKLAGRQVGIREVVEWVNENIAFANIPMSYKEWQAKLKEWGIEWGIE